MEGSGLGRQVDGNGEGAPDGRHVDGNGDGAPVGSSVEAFTHGKAHSAANARTTACCSCKQHSAFGHAKCKRKRDAACIHEHKTMLLVRNYLAPHF